MIAWDWTHDRQTAVLPYVNSVHMIIPYFYFVSIELANTSKSPKHIEVVVQDGDLHKPHSGLSFFRSSNPAGVTQITGEGLSSFRKNDGLND